MNAILLIGLLVMVAIPAVSAYPTVFIGNETVTFPVMVYHGGVLTQVPGPIIETLDENSTKGIGELRSITFYN